MIGSESNPGSAIGHPQSAAWRDALAVGASAFALRAALILAYPLIYGGDPVIRLIESHRILISYQLPGLQTVIFLIHALGGGVFASRLAVAALSALAAAGLCRLMALRGNRGLGVLAGLIFAFNPFVVYFSLVPYQFPLVLAAAHWGLYFYLRRRSPLDWAACGLCFGIACLTRYEAWVFVACVGAASIWERTTWYRHRMTGSSTAGAPNVPPGQPTPTRFPLPRLLGHVVAVFLLFGWGALAWLVFQHGINPAGTFVIGGIDEWGQMLRPLTTGALLLGLSGPVIVATSVIGLSTLRRELGGPAGRMWMFAAVWIVCSAIALVFSAHPVQPPSARLASFLASVGIQPTPAMFVTGREGHLYVSLLSILSALGILRIGRLRIGRSTEQAAARNPQSAIRTATAGLVTAILLGHSAWIATDRVRRSTDDPNLRAAAAAARAVDALLETGGRAVVLAKPLPPGSIQDYLNRAQRTGGTAGLRQARALLASIETGPWAYQRMLVHSRYDRRRLLDVADVGQPGGSLEAALHARDVRYCVVFNDFVARLEVELAIAARAASGQLVASIDTGPGVRIYTLFRKKK